MLTAWDRYAAQPITAMSFMGGQGATLQPDLLRTLAHAVFLIGMT
jgi:hypothetical protein